MLGVLRDTGGITWEDMLKSRILPDYTGARLPSLGQDAQRTELKWSVDGNDRGIYEATSPQAQVYTGHAGQFEESTRGRIRVTSPGFVALTVTPLDDAAKKILVTACGRCENTGVQFSPDRRTVGRNWGEAPVRIEAVRGRMVLPEGKWTCHALAPDGSPGQNVLITYENGRGVLKLSPEYGTMWYLLERQTK